MTKLGKLSFGFAALSLICFLVVRVILTGWIPFLWVLLGMVGFFILLGMWFERATLVDFFTMKTTKSGLNMGAMIVLVISALVLINVLGVRNYKTFDFTQAKLNSLSDQSAKVVKGLDDELKVKLFYQKGTQGIEEAKERFRRTIRLYQDASDKVTLEFVDVDEKPKTAEEYGVNKGAGLAFVEYKGRRNRVDKIDDEQELTNAIIKTTREKDKVVYYAQGAGELSLEDTQSIEGSGITKSALEGIRFVVKPINLNTTPVVPADAEILAIIGPKQKYFPAAVAGIETFLQNGGSLLLALEPKATAGLEPLLAKMGLSLSNRFSAMLLKTAGGIQIDPRFPVIGLPANKTHPLVKDLPPNSYLEMKSPQAVTTLPDKDQKLTHENVIKTYPETVEVDSLADLENPSKLGQPQEFPVLVSVKGTLPGATDAKEFMALVSGDADIFNNQALSKPLLRDVAMSSFAYLGKDTDLISIAPKDPAVTKMEFTPKIKWAFIAFVFLLPIFLLGSGVFVFIRRRSA